MKAVLKPLLMHGTIRIGRLVFSFYSRWRWDYGTTEWHGQKGWFRNLGFFYFEIEPKNYWME